MYQPYQSAMANYFMYAVVCFYIIAFYIFADITGVGPFGVRPNAGIIFTIIGSILAPFFHVNADHLFSNMIGFAIAAPVVCKIINTRQLLRTFVCGIIVVGFLTSFFDVRSFEETAHVGSSGLGFVFVTIAVFYGTIEFDKMSLFYVLSWISCLLLFSISFFTIFPVFVEEQVSWQMHLAGFIVGLILITGFHSERNTAILTIFKEQLTSADFLSLTHFDGFIWDGNEIHAFGKGSKSNPFCLMEFQGGSLTRTVFTSFENKLIDKMPFSYGWLPKEL